MHDERLPEEAARKGEYVLTRLHEMATRHDLIGEVRGLGLMIGIELVTDRATKEPAPRQAAHVRRLCREAGVLIGVGGQSGNVVRFQPPLVISDADIDRALTTLDRVLAFVVAE
jgi:4-aminobutyrate aminotransferase-like enzyme